MQARRIAIFWPAARAMANYSPSDFDTALNVLADIAQSLADHCATRAHPKEVAIFVE